VAKWKVKSKQITLANALLGISRRKKVSKALGIWGTISDLVNWSELALIVSILDKIQSNNPFLIFWNGSLVSKATSVVTTIF
jgi:hypothetical protein